VETRTKNRIALRRLEMPLTHSVADAPSIASRHVAKRITLSEIGPARENSMVGTKELFSKVVDRQLRG
jgi:hypothetical protein